MNLPADLHAHTEFSWDTRTGDMEGSCARAVELGLPAIAFTEHTDFVSWTVDPAGVPERWTPYMSDPAHLTAPALDVGGYLEAIDRCRAKYPTLRIITGVELGEPHWFAREAAALLASAPFERVIGSLHSLRVDGAAVLVEDEYTRRPVEAVLRDYFAEVVRMVEAGGDFSTLTHLDYPVRYLPAGHAFRIEDFEEEVRQVLRSLAGTSRALEINTRRTLEPTLVHWWREAGGAAVSFGSDAHRPEAVATNFAAAAALAESAGFRPGRHPYDHWIIGRYS
ncbi:histidinol-phosphatase HisJ family protein [Dactylosporangium matsuzakiense]|uniref:Histidinol-phosphatase n=1 Tax=Dactylosporangium matsuzakiense TaxID=53360 RepID=A0A9W6NHW8_9ACTN|nr:histidinol-phosphatase HisJ family protein [Dactylosporangium matsuzakiense]GLK98299.1 histidinol-phosphatase [Dactylosporangium matsuzakiense]